MEKFSLAEVRLDLTSKEKQGLNQVELEGQFSTENYLMKF
jgi:hypothetical protein